MKKRKIFTLPKDTKPTGAIIKGLIEKHKEYIVDYAKLESYYEDEPKIERKKPTDIVIYHNFAKYITTLNVGHLLGNPVEYQATKGVDIDPVLDLFKAQTISDLDADIAEDCSVYGRGYELVFIDEESQVNSVKLDVYNTILVYDKSFKPKKQFAIVYSPKLDEKGKIKPDSYDITVWTDKYILTGDMENGKFIE